MARKVTIIAALAVMALAASIITAQAEECTLSSPATEAMGPGLSTRIINQLNLTPAQVTQLTAIRNDFMNATADLRGQLNVKLNEMATLWATNTTTTDQLKAKADEIDVVRTQIRNIGIDYLARARTVLTPDQIAKVDQMIKDNPGWLFGMACTMGVEAFKGQKQACPGAVAKGPMCQAVAPACPKVECQAVVPSCPATVGTGPCGCQQCTPSCPAVAGTGPCGCQEQVSVPGCPACTPAPPAACPNCVDLYMYRTP